MNPSRRPSRGRSPLVTLTLLFFALLIGVVGTGGTLAAMGQLDLSFIPFFKKEGPQIPPGAIPIPISGRAIPAYTKITRDDLFDAKSGKFAFVYLQQDQIAPQTMLQMTEVLGRVLDHDKPAGYVFTEKDFMPKGTRSGLTAGIPPGKRAYRLDASKISGVHGLQSGDHLDLIASAPLEQATARIELKCGSTP